LIRGGAGEKSVTYERGVGGAAAEVNWGPSALRGHVCGVAG